MRTLATDFDETITIDDTISRLPALAAKALPAEEQAAFLARWRDGSTAYYREWERVFAEALDAIPSSEPPETALEAFLRRFRDLERDSLTMVQAEGFLRGIRREHLLEIGRSVPKHDGALAVLGRSLETGLAVHIISVNWSVELIRGGLDGLEVPIHANDLEFDENGVSTGRLLRRLSSAFDKRACLAAITQGASGSVYIGDSITDLLALLDAEVGILFGDKPRTLAVCERVGIPVVPLKEAGTRSDGLRLYRAESWDEIGAFLFGGEAVWRERVGVEPTADA